MREHDDHAGSTFARPGDDSAPPRMGPSWGRAGLTITVVALIAFALGFLPQWARVQGAERDARELRRELAVAELRGEMGSALAQANRSNFEAARRHMVTVFQGMERQLDEVEPALRERYRAALGERDELITLLSRASPESTPRLVMTYLRSWGEERE